MLSDKEILDAIKNGLLIVEPFDKEMLRPACLNLRLGPTIFEQVQKGLIDPYDKESMKKCYKRVEIDDTSPCILKPNAFILALTYEKIGISKSLGVLLDGTSTLARLGISITQTAAIVDTGHGFPKPRRLTLEIKNNGLNPVKLYYKMKVVRMAIFRLEKEASFGYDEKGKYKDGSVIPKPVKP